MWLLIFLMIGSSGVLILALILSVDTQAAFANIKDRFFYTNYMINERMANYSMLDRKLSKLILYTENLIARTNIRIYMPYGVITHLLVCFAIMAITYNWVISYTDIFISILFSIMGFIMPYLLLDVISSMIAQRLKGHSVDFLIILKNFLMATGDIFSAFEQSRDFTIEPLKTYIDIMIYEYKHKVDPVYCIEGFADKLMDSELKLFIQNLEIAYISGSDISLLLDEFITEIGRLNEDSDKEDAEDRILNFGLYLLLFINFTVIYFIMVSKTLSVANTSFGQAVFIIDIFISIFIIVSTLKKG